MLLWSVGIVAECWRCCGMLELLWHVEVVVECRRCCGV